MKVIKTTKQTECWNCFATLEYSKKDIKHEEGYGYKTDYIVCPNCGEDIVLHEEEIVYAIQEHPSGIHRDGYGNWKDKNNCLVDPPQYVIDYYNCNKHGFCE